MAARPAASPRLEGRGRGGARRCRGGDGPHVDLGVRGDNGGAPQIGREQASKWMMPEG